MKNKCKCGACGCSDVVTTKQNIKVPYCVDGKEGQDIIEAECENIPIHECCKCHFTFLDSEAEQLIDQQISMFRKSK